LADDEEGKGPKEQTPRAHPRYEVELRVDWSTGRMFVSGQAVNISEGGVCVQTQSAASLAEKAQVEMVLWLPGRGPIKAVGHVVWSYDGHAVPTGVMPGGGLRFTDMRPEDRAMLLDYLREVGMGRKPARGH
jgi:uncharacterized protein (TIGR02266 family)